MKIKYSLFIFLLGAVVGICLPLLFRNKRTEDSNVIQRDTTVVHDTVRYSRLDLSGKTYRLEIPDIGLREYVFIAEDSTTIIYRDNIRYVTALRDFFYTRTTDAEIWHSGVDSRIDSLNVFGRTSLVTQTIRPRDNLHSIGIGMEANYSDTFRVPIQLEYSYKVRSWLSVYGYAELELFTKRFSMGAGAKIQLEW